MTYQKPKKPKALDLGILECRVPDCRLPRGKHNVGFTAPGLANHMSRLHKTNYTPLVATIEEFMETPQKTKTSRPAGSRTTTNFDPGPLDGIPDPGTPGDEVVMGTVQPLIDDIKDVIGADHKVVMAEDEEGVYIRGWRYQERFVANRDFDYDTKTGWRVINGKRMRPRGKDVSASIVAETEKRFPYEQPTAMAPVGSAADEGVRVKARKGVLYVDDQPANLQAFIDGLRLAVKIS